MTFDSPYISTIYESMYNSILSILEIVRFEMSLAPQLDFVFSVEYYTVWTT